MQTELPIISAIAASLVLSSCGLKLHTALNTDDVYTTGYDLRQIAAAKAKAENEREEAEKQKEAVEAAKQQLKNEEERSSGKSYAQRLGYYGYNPCHCDCDDISHSYYYNNYGYEYGYNPWSYSRQNRWSYASYKPAPKVWIGGNPKNRNMKADTVKLAETTATTEPKQVRRNPVSSGQANSDKTTTEEKTTEEPKEVTPPKNTVNAEETGGSVTTIPAAPKAESPKVNGNPVNSGQAKSEKTTTEVKTADEPREETMPKKIVNAEITGGNITTTPTAPKEEMPKVSSDPGKAKVDEQDGNNVTTPDKPVRTKYTEPEPDPKAQTDEPAKKADLLNTIFGDGPATPSSGKSTVTQNAEPDKKQETPTWYNRPANTNTNTNTQRSSPQQNSTPARSNRTQASETPSEPENPANSGGAVRRRR